MKPLNDFPKLLLFSGIALGAFSATAQTTTIFSDNFDSGTTAWSTDGNVNISIDTGDQFGSGDSLSGDVLASVNLLTTTFSSQSLSSVGDSISVSFDYMYNGSAGNTDYVPAFGLYDGAASDGYYGRVDSNELYIQKENDSQAGLIAGNTDIVDSKLYSSNHSYDGGAIRFGLTIALTGVNEVTVTMSHDDLTPTNDDHSFSYTDSSPYLNFDTFALRSRSTDYFIDNVTVDTVAVPEPSTFAILTGVLAVLFAVRRKQRR